MCGKELGGSGRSRRYCLLSEEQRGEETSFSLSPVSYRESWGAEADSSTHICTGPGGDNASGGNFSQGPQLGGRMTS